MVKIKQRICYIAEHAGNVLHQQEQQHFLAFIYLMIKLNKLSTTPQRALELGQPLDF